MAGYLDKLPRNTSGANPADFISEGGATYKPVPQLPENGGPGFPGSRPAAGPSAAAMDGMPTMSGATRPMAYGGPITAPTPGRLNLNDPAYQAYLRGTNANVPAGGAGVAGEQLGALRSTAAPEPRIMRPGMSGLGQTVGARVPPGFDPSFARPAGEAAGEAARAFSPFMDDLGAVARGFNGAVEGAGRGIGRVMSSPLVNNPLTRTVGRIAGPVGAAVGAYNTVDELMNPNSAPRQRFSAFNQNLDAGNVGTAAKNAYYGVGDMVGTFTGLKPLARMIAGSDRPQEITMDAQGNFSRAPTNKAEYDDMMRMKYDRSAAPPRAAAGAEGSATSPFPVSPRDGASATSPTLPTMRQAMSPQERYDNYVRSTPANKLDADGYARAQQLEIDRLRPEREARNREMAESYATQHPYERGQDKVLANMGHLLTGTGQLEHARAQAATEQQRADAATMTARSNMLGSQAQMRGADAQMKTAERPVIDNHPVDTANRQLFDSYKVAAQKRKEMLRAQNPNADTSAIDAELLNIRDRIFGKHTYSTDEVMRRAMENASKIEVQ